jgi:hypothetical protein
LRTASGDEYFGPKRTIMGLGIYLLTRNFIVCSLHLIYMQSDEIWKIEVGTVCCQNGRRKECFPNFNR